jgi:HTH-type transcriptional regulator / antitoxin HigA
MSYTLAEAFPVGDFLAEELDRRGWSQAEFAEILGRPAQYVSEIVSNKKEITRDSAAQIGAALGTSAVHWLKLQDTYHLWRQAQDDETQAILSEVRRRARLTNLAPISVLRKRGYISGNTLQQQEEELKRLYRIDDIGDEPAILVAARRSVPGGALSPTQLAWIVCVRHKAEMARVGRFQPEELRKLAKRLVRIVKAPEDFAMLPGLFARAGVRLVYVEAFPSSKMDGCTFLLDSGSPVIGISGRGKRLDKVLFTILHEMAHLLLEHLQPGQYIIDDENLTPALEEKADEFAGSFVFSTPLPTLPMRVSMGWVKATALEHGVHWIVLVGHLQKRKRLPWRTTLVKGAPTVSEQLEAW